MSNSNIWLIRKRRQCLDWSCPYKEKLGSKENNGLSEEQKYSDLCQDVLFLCVLCLWLAIERFPAGLR